ncbi:MAG: small multi-drug export protein [bacterium]|nr:small multi-drug export protein [bacterium]
MIWYAILLSMLPISELRGGIPFAYYSTENIFLSFFVCVIANIIIIPIIFFFLDHIHKDFLEIPIYKKLSDFFIERARKKTEKNIKKYGFIGLTLLVAIPLPITGAYTGTLAAWFFNMRGRKAYISLALGVIIAGIIVSVVTYTGAEAFSIFIKE